VIPSLGPTLTFTATGGRLERLDRGKTIGDVRRMLDGLEAWLAAHAGPDQRTKPLLIIDHQ
jgi:hypothetical protein